MIINIIVILMCAIYISFYIKLDSLTRRYEKLERRYYEAEKTLLILSETFLGVLKIDNEVKGGKDEDNSNC